jgi:hypothetical protein
MSGGMTQVVEQMLASSKPWVQIAVPSQKNQKLFLWNLTCKFKIVKDHMLFNYYGKLICAIWKMVMTF